MKNIGVTFNDFHTFRDWDLHWESVDISEPVAITHYIDIPGRKTKIDATEALYGGITYENRTITLGFWVRCKPPAWMRLDSKIQRAIGGKRCKIILDIEPDRYWMGRVTVQSNRRDEAEYILAQYTITCDVEPYKYWDQEPQGEDWLWDPFSFIDGVIQNTKDIQITSSGVVGMEITIPAYPVITATSNMSVVVNGRSYSLKANQAYEIDQELEGYVDFSFTGTGRVSIGLRGETL